VLIIKGHPPLAGDEAEAFAHLQQKLLHVIEQRALQLGFSIEVLPFQPQEFKYVGVPYHLGGGCPEFAFFR